jgi:hypothetical protein
MRLDHDTLPMRRSDHQARRGKFAPQAPALAGGMMTALLPADISSLFLAPDLHRFVSPIAMRAGNRIIGLSRVLGDCHV